MDTTLAEVVLRGDQSGMQDVVNAVEQWSIVNKLQLNADKCTELFIDFKIKHHFDAVTVNSQDLERVDSVKLLGVTICNQHAPMELSRLGCNPKAQQENILSYTNKACKYSSTRYHLFLSYLYKTRSKILCPSESSSTA